MTFSIDFSVSPLKNNVKTGISLFLSQGTSSCKTVLKLDSPWMSNKLKLLSLNKLLLSVLQKLR